MSTKWELRGDLLEADFWPGITSGLSGHSPWDYGVYRGPRRQPTLILLHRNFRIRAFFLMIELLKCVAR